jgi:hypothetical protein
MFGSETEGVTGELRNGEHHDLCCLLNHVWVNQERDGQGMWHVYGGSEKCIQSFGVGKGPLGKPGREVNVKEIGWGHG